MTHGSHVLINQWLLYLPHVAVHADIMMICYTVVKGDLQSIYHRCVYIGVLNMTFFCWLYNRVFWGGLNTEESQKSTLNDIWFWQ